MRIFIVDDHPLVRKGIRDTISEAKDMTVCGEAANGSSALEWLEKNTCDVVILDLSLPDIHGLELLEQFQTRWKSLPVLVLTMQAEEQYATRVLKMGGAGFLPKDSPPDQLLVALRKVGSGGRFVTPALAEKLIFQWEKKDTAPHEALSHREFLVMKLMAVGKPPKEIAQELSISVKTVSTYRTRILAKLGCQSNAEMVRYCIEHQLIENGR